MVMSTIFPMMQTLHDPLVQSVPMTLPMLNPAFQDPSCLWVAFGVSWSEGSGAEECNLRQGSKAESVSFGRENKQWMVRERAE